MGLTPCGENAGRADAVPRYGDRMEKRKFGRTGLSVSVLTFGCGAVGGLMTRGAPADQQRAVARAVEAGVNHFDTAPLYGDGASEENLGRVLLALKPNVIVSTKVRLPAERNMGAIAASLVTSLRRLKRDHVDLFQLHNAIGAPAGQTLSAEEVLRDVVPAFNKMREQGKTRFIGFTAIGETQALHTLVASGAFDAAQVPFNVLNPSPAEAIPAAYPAQDYGRILDLAEKHGLGTIGIRVLAGGALSGSEARNPLDLAVVDPIGSGGAHPAGAGPARRLQAVPRRRHCRGPAPPAHR